MTSHNFDGCILAAEVAGDAALLSRLGENETARAIERCRNRAERAVEAHSGVPMLAKGRRLIAHFSKADNAILAAFDMRERVAQLPPLSGTKLLVRIVVHANPRGDAAKAQIARDETCVILGAVENSLIVVSEEAAELLSDSIRSHMAAAEPTAVPGLISATNLYAFNSDTQAPSREAAFSPTTTSVTIEPSAFDTTTHSQSPMFGPAAKAEHKTALVVRHFDSSFVISESRPVLLAGREEGNDLVIVDRRASRHHARIEWRKNRFVLIDTSTNGTYMVDGAGTEVLLRRHEADLPEEGRIGCGFSPLEAGAEAVFFSVHSR